MINVSELMFDPDFVRSFVVRRPSGAFDATGIYTSSYEDFAFTGAVQPATPAELQMLPSGSTQENVISVWSAAEMRMDNGNDVGSDLVIVDGASYRVIKAEPRGDNGYFRVFAEGIVT